MDTKYLTKDFSEVEGFENVVQQKVAQAKAQHVKPLTLGEFRKTELLSGTAAAQELVKELFMCGMCSHVVGKQLACRECEKRFCEDCFAKIQFCQNKTCPCCKATMQGVKA